VKVLINGSFAPSLILFRGNLIRDLIARGHEVHCSAPDIKSEIMEQLQAIGAVAHGISLNRTGAGVIADLQYFWDLFRLIKRIKPDFVVGYTIKPNIWGSIAAQLNGISSASMVTGLGYTFITKSGWKRRLIGLISHRLYRLATGCNKVVIFQNPDDRDDFVAAKCLINPSKARLVNGSGVDTDYYPLASLPDRPVFLMIARLLGNKGTREYAAAAMSLIDEGRVNEGLEWQFQLAGFLDEGPDCVRAEELRHWIDSGIEFLGELKDIRPAMRSASVYVLPSYREGTPRSVLEAMSIGRPVITSDAPGCRETVEHGVNGFLVPVQDVKTLIAAMKMLGESARLRSSFGIAGRKIAEEKYAVGRVNSVLMDHFGL
jgi:glycosyltransferase involved in cell wall biosynthesis